MGESLRGICEDEKMPEASTVCGWVIKNREGFNEQYARARQAQALIWAEDILCISDNDSKDWRVDDKGNLIIEAENVQRSRLRVDSRKWLLSKVLPKVYGDKVTLAGDSEAPLEVNVIRKVVAQDAED